MESKKGHNVQELLAFESNEWLRCERGDEAGNRWMGRNVYLMLTGPDEVNHENAFDWVHPGLVVRFADGKCGRGVFSTQDIDAGAPIAFFKTGDAVSAEGILGRSSEDFALAWRLSNLCAKV